MSGIGKDSENKMEQVYEPHGEKMTEIEAIKAQIQVLQEKLSFLEELEKRKSPVEEAYKLIYGMYPETYSDTWSSFQNGYYAARGGQIEPSMVNCVITGNPPDGYFAWSEWYNELGSKGILHNLRISSKDYKVEKHQETKTKTWYLLYAGTSTDGRGDGNYVGRTTDVSVARKHWDDCQSNPYSVGKVIAVTDTKHRRIVFDYEWETYEQGGPQ